MSAMFFDQPPFAFRLKVSFDPLLNKEDAYVFINVAKTPTIESFVNDIRKRFELDKQLRVSLHGVGILPSENILVLADVNQVGIKPMAVEAISSRTNYLQESITEPPDTFPKPKKASCEKTESSETAQIKGKEKGMPKLYAGRGMADFLRQLREEDGINSHEPKRMKKSDGATGSEIKDIVKYHSTKIVDTKERNCNEDSSNIEICDANSDNSYTLEKKKRHRKRKHSKKRNGNNSGIDEIDLPTERELTTFNLSHNTADSSIRKHIYFNNNNNNNEEDVDDDNTAGDTKCVSETKAKTNNSLSPFISSPPENVEINSASSKLSLINGAMEIEDSTRSTVSVNLSSKEVTPNLFAEMKNKLYKPCKPTSKSVLTPRTFPASAENENIFSTLLMMKQMKTPNQYNITFSNLSESQKKEDNYSVSQNNDANDFQNDISQKNHDSSLTTGLHTTELKNNDVQEIIRKKLLTVDFSSPGGENSVIETTANDLSDSEECQMLLHFQINNDKILLHKDDEWITLTTEISENSLPLIEIPRENQLIVFQMLFLKHSLWPTLSDLMYGRVVNYETGDQKVTLEIPPSFVVKIVQGKYNEYEFPDGMTHIHANVYCIDWIAIKNPRLLS